MSAAALTHPTPFPNDESLLDSLFERIGPSPTSLLKAALRFASEHPTQLTPQLLVESLKARGEQKAALWLERLGPTTGVQGAMLHSGLSKSGVHKAKESNRILAFRLSGQNHDHFPLFQFKAGKVRDWIPRLLAITGNGIAGAHFLAVARKSLNGRGYVELLREEDKPDLIDRMLRQAESAGDPARYFSAEYEPYVDPS